MLLYTTVILSVLSWKLNRLNQLSDNYTAVFECG